MTGRPTGGPPGGAAGHREPSLRLDLDLRSNSTGDTPRDPDAGPGLRDRGQQLALDATDGWWRSTAAAAVEHLASTGEPFTAEHVRDLGVGEPRSQAAWGALIRAYARRGMVERVGYRPASRPEAHARALAVWRGTRRGLGLPKGSPEPSPESPAGLPHGSGGIL